MSQAKRARESGKRLKERLANEARRKKESEEFLASEEGKKALERQRTSYIDGTASQVSRAIGEAARKSARERLLMPMIKAYSCHSVDELMRVAEYECSSEAESKRLTGESALLERRMCLAEVADIVLAQRAERAKRIEAGEEIPAEATEIHERAHCFALAEAIARVKILSVSIDVDMAVVVEPLDIPPAPTPAPSSDESVPEEPRSAGLDPVTADEVHALSDWEAERQRMVDAIIGAPEASP